MRFISEFKLAENIYEIHSAIIFKSQQDASEALLKLAKALKAQKAKAAAIEVFAPIKYQEQIETFKSQIDANACPINFVLPLDEQTLPELAGIHITSIRGADVKYSQTPAGVKISIVEAGSEKYFRTFGICPIQDDKTLDVYTESVLQDLKDALVSENFDFSDTARTWFYNYDILGWYADFNKGRTKFFNENKVFDGLLPASTGIGSPNPANSKIQCGVIAVKDGAKRDKIIELPSPLQGGATEYGSSFSRAVELSFDSYKRIMVSGTASIAPSGETLYYGDIKKQVALTMDVIENILKSRGMDFSDTIRSVVYCMNPEFYQEFLIWQKERNLDLPHVPSYSTVCRYDLMFEVELDAAKNI